jgi:hypothetical protein
VANGATKSRGRAARLPFCRREALGGGRKGRRCRGALFSSSRTRWNDRTPSSRILPSVMGSIGSKRWPSRSELRVDQEIAVRVPQRRRPCRESRQHHQSGGVPAQIAAGVADPMMGEGGGPKLDPDGRPLTEARYTGLHALSHFYASWCINREEDGGLGLPGKVVQERLGHSSIVMTMDVYGHLFKGGNDGAALAKAAEKLWPDRDTNATWREFIKQNQR